MFLISSVETVSSETASPHVPSYVEFARTSACHVPPPRSLYNKLASFPFFRFDLLHWQQNDSLLVQTAYWDSIIIVKMNLCFLLQTSSPTAINKCSRKFLWLFTKHTTFQLYFSLCKWREGIVRRCVWNRLELIISHVVRGVLFLHFVLLFCRRFAWLASRYIAWLHQYTSLCQLCVHNRGNRSVSHPPARTVSHSRPPPSSASSSFAACYTWPAAFGLLSGVPPWNVFAQKRSGCFEFPRDQMGSVFSPRTSNGNTHAHRVIAQRWVLDLLGRGLYGSVPLEVLLFYGFGYVLGIWTLVSELETKIIQFIEFAQETVV